MEDLERSELIIVENKGIKHAVDMYQENLEGKLCWMQDNEYLLRGYRSQLSFWDALKSLGRSTNETMNIWTHIVGALEFVVLFFVLYLLPGASPEPTVATKSSLLDTIIADMSGSFTDSTSIPRWPISVFIICAVWCLMGSAIFHTFYVVSELVKDILQTLDYLGICILISGSYVPIIYYGLYCYTNSLRFHLITIVILNIVTVCVLAAPKFRQPKYRSLRSICFTAVSCYAVFPLIHMYVLDGLKNPLFITSFFYILAMGATYILGAIFYGSRIPEKFFPGYCDYMFASHQFFHVCIVVAAFFHYVGSYQLMVATALRTCPV